MSSCRATKENVWLGTTCEDQVRADERLPHLLAVPASVRFVSYEPALGPVDFGPYLPHAFNREPHCPWCEDCIPSTAGMEWWKQTREDRHGPFLDWIIVGGESGPGARPFYVEWARSVIEQCKAAGTAVFVKQLGDAPKSKLSSDRNRPKLSPKAGNPDEWPEDLRVREWPR